MGRHSRAMKMAQDVPMSESDIDWHPEGRRRLGRGRTGLSITVLRLKDEILEMDYRFTTGGATLEGTMYLPYEKDEELGQLADKIEQMCKESFHGVRRSRD